MTVPSTSFESWCAAVAPAERYDPLWRMMVYRYSRYVVEAGWADVSRLNGVALGRAVADQLWRALGSIPANIAEGYSRGSGADRARCFEYALGSTREAIAWYYAAQPLLGAATVQERLDPLTQIRRMLLTLIPIERRRRKGEMGTGS